MSSAVVSMIAFAILFGGAMAGLLLRHSLPNDHLTGDSKETVKQGIGFVSTMAALVLGLLVSSAKSFYDTQSTEVNQMSADVVALDRLLDHYGPEANDARKELRVVITNSLDRIWTGQRTSEAPRSDRSRETLLDQIQALSPKDDRQRSLQSQALSITVGIGRIRWLMYEQSKASVSRTLLVIMVFWLTVIFTSFGLFAPRNAIAITSLLAAAFSVSGAIFLILEMYTPYRGLVQISSAPLRSALEHLGQ